MKQFDYHRDIHDPNQDRVFAPTANQYAKGQRVGDDSGDVLSPEDLQALIRAREDA